MSLKVLLAGCALAASFAITAPAFATVLTFDDLGVPETQFPDINAGPIGFVELGYQFSGNEVVYDVHDVANGPAFSGNYAAFNDFSGFGAFVGANAFFTTVTKAGGGTFSFNDVELQSFSHSANGSISGIIEGLNADNVLVGILPFANVLSWTDISTSDADSIGNFNDITTLIIEPNNYTLIDNLQVNEMISTSPTPEPATWAMMLVGFGGLGAALRTSRRRQAAATA